MLAQRLESQIDERKAEIDFWVQERATMRQRIEQLEQAKPEKRAIDSAEVEDLKAKVKGAAKKLKAMDYEHKTL